MNFDRLKILLDDLADGKRLSGSSCIVSYKNEKVFSYSTGYSDVENKIPMTGEELFFIYSMTKPITCTAALQLFEKGKFLLSDPLYCYIPEYKNMTVKTETGIITECKNPIRIEDLFTMSAGFNYNLRCDIIEEVKKRTDGKVPTTELARVFASQPLEYEPGTHWRYSWAHDVLAAVVEIISGKRYSDYVKENIFEPLGMKNTGFDETVLDTEAFAKKYNYDKETNSLKPFNLKCIYKLGSEHDSGGAGLISTVSDYSLFAKVMANFGTCENGERIISRNTINMMRRNFLDKKRLENFGDWYSKRGYGYGLGVRTMIDLARGGANGNIGEFGWDGAAGSYVLIDPESNLSITYMQHVLNASMSDEHRKIKNVVYSCIE